MPKILSDLNCLRPCVIMRENLSLRILRFIWTALRDCPALLLSGFWKLSETKDWQASLKNSETIRPGPLQLLATQKIAKIYIFLMVLLVGRLSLRREAQILAGTRFFNRTDLKKHLPR